MRPSQRLLLPGLALALLAILWICSRTLGTSGGGEISFSGDREVLAAEEEGLQLPGTESDEVDADRDGREQRREILVPDPPPTEEELAAAEENQGTRLFGTVTRAGGVPVEGAKIVLRRAQGWIATPADLEEMSALPSTGPVHEAETDAEGVFELWNVEAGAAALSIRAGGFSPLSRENLPVPQHESYDLGTFPLELGVGVSGQVIGPRGRGVEGVEILSAVSPDAGWLRLDLPGHGIPLARSDSEGQFAVDSLAPGSWHLIFDHPAYRVAELKGVTEPAGRTDPGKRVDLEAGLSIEGRVEGLDPIAEGPLRVTARRDREQPSGAADDVEGAEKHRPRHGEVLADGSFGVHGLAPGVRYKLRLARPRKPSPDDPEGLPERWRPVPGVDDAAVMAGAGQVVLTYRAESTVTLSVVDAETGRAVETLVVRVNGSRLGSGGVLKGDDEKPRSSFPGGEVRYEGLRPAEKGTPVTVRVRATGYEDLEKQGGMLWPGKTLEVGQVELVPAATVPVVVVDDETGDPIAGAQVLVARSFDSDALDQWVGRRGGQRPFENTKVRDAICNDRGVTEVTVWSASVCKVEAAAEGYLRGDPKQSIPPHQEKLELRLTRGARVEVVVIDGDGEPVAGMFVEHSVVGGGGGGGRMNGRLMSLGYFGEPEPGSKTNDNGVVTFDDLEAGRHRFRAVERRNPWGGRGASAGHEAEDELFLEEGGTAELELQVATRGGFRARILESGSPLAGGLARLSPIGDGEERDNFFFFGGVQEDPLTRVSDHAGRVSFAHLKVGSYELRISHPERRMTITREVEVVPEPIEQILEIGSAVIAGRILDPEGQPIAGVSISVSAASQRRSYDGGDYRVRITEDAEGDADWDVEQVKKWSIESDENGEYALRGVLPGVELSVHSSHRFVQGKTRQAGPLGTDEYLADFDFLLEPAGALRVKVPNLDRRDSRRVEVRVDRIGEDGKRRNRRTQRVRGWRPEVTLNSLPPGRWKVQLFVDRAKEALREVEVEEHPRQTARAELHL